jgi:hypothetical protein
VVQHRLRTLVEGGGGRCKAASPLPAAWPLVEARSDAKIRRRCLPVNGRNGVNASAAARAAKAQNSGARWEGSFASAAVGKEGELQHLRRGGFRARGDAGARYDALYRMKKRVPCARGCRRLIRISDLPSRADSVRAGLPDRNAVRLLTKRAGARLRTEPTK